MKAVIIICFIIFIIILIVGVTFFLYKDSCSKIRNLKSSNKEDFIKNKIALNKEDLSGQKNDNQNFIKPYGPNILTDPDNNITSENLQDQTSTEVLQMGNYSPNAKILYEKMYFTKYVPTPNEKKLYNMFSKVCNNDEIALHSIMNIEYKDFLFSLKRFKKQNLIKIEKDEDHFYDYLRFRNLVKAKNYDDKTFAYFCEKRYEVAHYYWKIVRKN